MRFSNISQTTLLTCGSENQIEESMIYCLENTKRKDTYMSSRQISKDSQALTELMVADESQISLVHFSVPTFWYNEFTTKGASEKWQDGHKLVLNFNSWQNFKSGNKGYLKRSDFVWMMSEKSNIEYWIYLPESRHPLMSMKTPLLASALVNDHEPISKSPTVAFIV